MIKTNEALTFSEDHIIHSLPKILGCSNKDILFIDIETTGLSLRSSDLYLIGASYYKDGSWQICQFFAEDINQEKEILEAFSEFSKGFSKVLHYNGDRFDPVNDGDEISSAIVKNASSTIDYTFEEGINRFKSIIKNKK